MKMTCRCMALVAAGWMLIANAGLAQTGASVPVAVVDIGEIFKEHPGFNRKVDALRDEVTQYEQKIQQDAEEVARQREALSQTYRPGTPQYKEQEERLARRQAELSTDAQLKRKEFMDQEAQLYFETYQEVQGVIAQFAKKYAIGLVLRFSRAEMEVENRQSILQGVYRPVVFHDKNLDITDHIVAAFTRTAQQPANASPAGGPRSARSNTVPANNTAR